MAFPVCEALQRSRAMAIACVPRHSANSKCNMQQGTATIKCHGHTLCAEHCINHVPWHSVCAKHCQITCHGNTLCAEHCINHVPWPYPVCHTIQQIQSVICSEALQQSRAMAIPCVRSTASITCHGIPRVRSTAMITFHGIPRVQSTATITCHGHTLCVKHCNNHVPCPYPVCGALHQSRAMAISCVRSTASITCHGFFLRERC